MIRILLLCAWMTLATMPGFSGTLDREAPGGQPRRLRALVPAELIHHLGSETRKIHDYGEFSLVEVEGEQTGRVGGHIHVLPVTDTVGFRGWRGRVPSHNGPLTMGGGVLILELIGPMDPTWRMRFEAVGVEILAPADSHALVVKTDGPSLARALEFETSEGFSIIRGFGPLPAEARVHRSLARVLDAGSPSADLELRVSGYGGRPLPIETKRAMGGGEVVRIPARDLNGLLADHPEIGYAEPVFDIELHNNLAARAGLCAVEPVWDLGYNGRDVTVSHNDSGVDLEHPDLADAVVASAGRMAYADTAHGTHTAGSIVGRGSSSSPLNTSGCGDLTEGLPSVRGMAWGAEIITNNIFEEGYSEVAEMMAWSVRNGAHLSSNSWGLVGLTGPEVSYSAAAAEADAAVRDADPDAPGPQPLAVFFSAGNTGPQPRTVTSPGTGKNVITIGAAQNDRCGSWVPDQQGGPDPSSVLTGSGRGPSQGRLKPDLAAPGSDVLSAESADSYAVQLWDESWTGAQYATNTGTSQACALAAGAGAVLYEYLWRNRGRRPSPALIKAALINAARYRREGADFDSGWGHLDLAASIERSESGSVHFSDQEETLELTTGMEWGTPIVVGSSSVPLELTLVWTDVPGEEDAIHPLVNDLDLVMTSPDGTTYRGNMLSAGGGWSEPNPGSLRDSAHNIEVIRVENPASGTWIVKVVGVDVAEAPVGLSGQDFALVYSGDAGPCSEPPPAPESVEAFVGAANQIGLSWSAVSGATRYEISRAENPGGHPWVPIAEVGAGVGSFVDTGVSGGSEYHYVVRAYRSCWSDYSHETSATAQGPCLLAPIFAGVASVDAPSGMNCSLETKWVPVAPRCPNPVLYSIYRGDEPDFVPGPDNLLVEDVTGSGRSDQRLEWGRDYYYAVRARHYGQDFDDGNTVVIGNRAVGPLDVYLEEDVEGSVDGWIRDQGSDADTGTEPWHVTDEDAWTGSRAWFIADEDRVKDQVLMVSEPIALPEESEPVLEFYHRYRLYRGRDGGRLEYSTNGGRDWFDILEGDGQTVPDDPLRWLAGGYTDTIGAPSNPLFLADGWTGDSRGWVYSKVALGDFAGRRVLFRWRMGCDATPGYEWGWWLDGIRLFEEHECGSCAVFHPPRDLSAVATDDGVLVDWGSSWPYNRIRVFRATKPEGPFEVLATVEAPEATYHDTSASGGTVYTYMHAVADEDCWSETSSGVTVTAGGPCDFPPIFWGIDEVIDGREAGCALDLQWRPADPGCPGAEVEYRVYRSPSADFVADPGSLLTDGVSGTRYRDLTVMDGEVVHYRVRAVDGQSGAEDANPVVLSGWTTGPEEIHFSDSVEGGLDAWWTAVGSSEDSGTEPWRVVDDFAHTGNRSWFCSNEPRIKDQALGLTGEFFIDDETTVISFAHYYDLEPFWDGGRFEYSTDGGTTWHDILVGDGSTVSENPDRFLRGGYTGFVSVGTGHPFGGERAWTGFDHGWTETVVNLADFVGLDLRFRWRLGCDRADARIGWWVDDVELRTTTTCENLELPPPRSGDGRRP